ncbi:efflux RND transporter periplasmic adaptor subunit [Xanthobacter pseudotagetidis]|uniref:efflux RND transporter periplasmic adaptor subunit n=1 Tax=Xanthobacter pseudotagetidis TaxID=3119911 RepID=UPI0037262F6D
MKARSWLRVLLVLLVAAAGVAAWRFTHLTEVRAVEVRRGTAAEIVYATGVVEPRRWAKVSTLQRQRIVSICDCEGRRVKQGDVLAQLDDSVEQATLAEMEARRARLEGDVARAKSLMDRQVASQTTYEQVLTQLREYEARVEAQKQRIEELKLRAPMDGVVLRKDGEVGEVLATTGDTTLFWIGEPKPLRIVADVNEDDIPRVKVGQKVLLRNDGYKDQLLDATVAEITPKGDPVNKTFRVYLSLPDDTPLSIGMSVEANIVVAEHDNVLLVPGEALIGDVAFRVEGRRLARTELRLGLRGTRMVEVLAGLKEGDLVASPATGDMRNGERVRVLGRTILDQGAATGTEGAPKGAAP